MCPSMDGREWGEEAGVIWDHFQEKGSIPEVLCSAVQARGPSCTSSYRSCTWKEVKIHSLRSEGFRREGRESRNLFQGGQEKSEAETPNLNHHSAAGRLLLLLLFLGKEGLQFHQFLYQECVQLPALQGCLLGPRKAARYLDLSACTPLPRDCEILKLQDPLPLLLADGDERTVSFLRLLENGL